MRHCAAPVPPFRAEQEFTGEDLGTCMNTNGYSEHSAGAALRLSRWVFLLLAVAWRPAPGRQSADTSEIAGILTVLRMQQDAWNRGDIGGYMPGYWNSDSLLFTSGGAVQRGWKSALEHYRKSYGSKTRMGRLDFSRLEVRLLSPGSAWVFGHWALRRENDSPGGVFTLILRKFPEGWKIVHDHTSKE
jgi:ketosteroid isomerase-like protein